MEKSTPHYRLDTILQQMTAVDRMNLTVTARSGIRAAGMSQVDALAAIRQLGRKDFYKSMTTHTNHRVWQDVYHGQFQGLPLYIKFQQAGEYFVVSFKEL